MEQKRIPVYGKDTEDKQKRAFDWIMIDGKMFIETVNRDGHKVRTPASAAITAYRKLQQQPVV